MIDRTPFFNRVRAGKLLGPSLSPREVDGLDAILDAMMGEPIAWTAYAMATAYLETWHTMQPIQERGSTDYFFRQYDMAGNRPAVAKALGNTHPGDGSRYCGRGFVQLSGRGLYQTASNHLGIDLVANPALALREDIAARIMHEGMKGGWFTGKCFASYLPTPISATKAQFISARRIINGQDRAGDIADYAVEFQQYLGG